MTQFLNLNSDRSEIDLRHGYERGIVFERTQESLLSWMVPKSTGFQAARLFARGESLAAVARTLAVTPMTACRWYAAWKVAGRRGLKGAGRAGRKPRLTAAEWRGSVGGWAPAGPPPGSKTTCGGWPPAPPRCGGGGAGACPPPPTGGAFGGWQGSPHARDRQRPG